MADGPFLTDLDSRAAIKGSRDPLGFQAIWTSLGRRIVINLTTVSTSLRDFTILLLGYYFVERVADEGDGEGDLATFLKWEQMAAYARAEINRETAFRGTERVQRRLSEAKGRVPVSTATDAQILSNQKTYGIWGLYTVPARASALVTGEPARLAPAGRELVEKVYLPALGARNVAAIVARLRRKQSTLDTRGPDRPLLEAIAGLLKARVLRHEGPAYRDHVVLGGPDARKTGLQPLLAEILRGTLDDAGWRLSRRRMRHLVGAARKHGAVGETLARELEEISICEMLLAASSALYEWMLGRDGQTPAALAKSLAEHWKANVPTIDVDATARLREKFVTATGGDAPAGRLLEIAKALAGGDYASAIKLLIDHNAEVMQFRGGAAAWIEIKDGRLHVRFRDEQGGRLPARDELPEYWRYPYFIDSLRTLMLALRA